MVKIDYKYSEERVKIHSKIGEVYEADHVIVTTSLGVLKAAKSDFFDPPLSQQKKHFIEVQFFNLNFGIKILSLVLSTLIFFLSRLLDMEV